MDYITFEAQGRSVSDPVEIKTNSDAKGVKGSIAINKSIPRGGGKFESMTMFLDYEYWGIDLEEALMKLGKGNSVKVTGDLKEYKWLSSNNEKRKSITLRIKTAKRINHE